MKIGIVTISFNQARFLEECIQSVVMMNPEDLRYVIVDPGSTDGSRDIIKKHKDVFHKIILDKDNGPPDGLNKGFFGLDADIYGYINSDDFFLPGALDSVKEFFEKNPETDIVIGRVKKIDENGKFISYVVAQNISLQNYLDKCLSFAQQSFFIRRKLFEEIGGFNIENRFFWDLELAIDALIKKPTTKIVYTRKAWGAFRFYTGTISSDPKYVSKYALQRERVCKKITNNGFIYSNSIYSKFKKILFILSPHRILNRFF